MMAESDTDIDFFTFGMFIIDEIHFLPPKDPVYNIIGGAGSYCALGARLFSPVPQSRSVGWIVDCGSDFPVSIRETIQNWETSCLLRETPKRLTTRAWNGYGEDEHRAFKYLTSKIRLDANSLTAKLLTSKSFHMVCAPARAIQIYSETMLRIAAEVKVKEKPVWVWEPVPDLCIPEELNNAYEAASLVDVISPNHQELAAFFGVSQPRQDDQMDRKKIEEMCQTFVKSGLGKDGTGAIVVRCGKEGCYYASRRESCWLPAFHQSGEKVVDPTGGGNTFLGGLGVALARKQCLHMASCWATVAASFAIEQIGTPSLTRDTVERWNGCNVLERLNEYISRVKD